MIASLAGQVANVAPDSAVIDVGGVGYLVFASRRTLEALQPGRPARVLVETHVREDHIHLYGFVDAAERDWFRLLLGVQGVGGRVALSILSVLPPDRLASAIAAQDRAAVTRADGVGPKLAQRILGELKDKAGGIALGPVARDGTGGTAAAPVLAGAEDAVSALVNLGYGRADAFAAVARAARALGDGAPLDRLITGALRELAQ